MNTESGAMLTGTKLETANTAKRAPTGNRASRLRNKLRAHGLKGIQEPGPARAPRLISTNALEDCRRAHQYDATTGTARLPACAVARYLTATRDGRRWHGTGLAGRGGRRSARTRNAGGTPGREAGGSGPRQGPLRKCRNGHLFDPATVLKTRPARQVPRVPAVRRKPATAEREGQATRTSYRLSERGEPCSPGTDRA